MSEFTARNVGKALDGLDLESVFTSNSKVAILVDDEAVKAEVVARVDEAPYQALDVVYGYDVWMVFKIGDQHFKRFGYWSSHEGRSWHAGRTVEVNPMEKMVVVYE